MLAVGKKAIACFLCMFVVFFWGFSCSHLAAKNRSSAIKSKFSTQGQRKSFSSHNLKKEPKSKRGGFRKKSKKGNRKRISTGRSQKKNKRLKRKFKKRNHQGRTEKNRISRKKSKKSPRSYRAPSRKKSKKVKRKPRSITVLRKKINQLKRTFKRTKSKAKKAALRKKIQRLEEQYQRSQKPQKVTRTSIASSSATNETAVSLYRQLNSIRDDEIKQKLKKGLSQDGIWSENLWSHFSPDELSAAEITLRDNVLNLVKEVLSIEKVSQISEVFGKNLYNIFLLGLEKLETFFSENTRALLLEKNWLYLYPGRDALIRDSENLNLSNATSVENVMDRLLPLDDVIITSAFMQMLDESHKNNNSHKGKEVFVELLKSQLPSFKLQNVMGYYLEKYDSIVKNDLNRERNKNNLLAYSIAQAMFAMPRPMNNGHLHSKEVLYLILREWMNEASDRSSVRRSYDKSEEKIHQQLESLDEESQSKVLEIAFLNCSSFEEALSQYLDRFVKENKATSEDIRKFSNQLAKYDIVKQQNDADVQNNDAGNVFDAQVVSILESYILKFPGHNMTPINYMNRYLEEELDRQIRSQFAYQGNGLREKWGLPDDKRRSSFLEVDVVNGIIESLKMPKKKLSSEERDEKIIQVLRRGLKTVNAPGVAWEKILECMRHPEEPLPYEFALRKARKQNNEDNFSTEDVVRFVAENIHLYKGGWPHQNASVQEKEKFISKVVEEYKEGFDLEVYLEKEPLIDLARATTQELVDLFDEANGRYSREAKERDRNHHAEIGRLREERATFLDTKIENDTIAYSNESEPVHKVQDAKVYLKNGKFVFEGDYLNEIQDHYSNCVYMLKRKSGKTLDVNIDQLLADPYFAEENLPENPTDTEYSAMQRKLEDAVKSYYRKDLKERDDSLRAVQKLFGTIKDKSFEVFKKDENWRRRVKRIYNKLFSGNLFEQVKTNDKVQKNLIPELLDLTLNNRFCPDGTRQYMASAEARLKVRQELSFSQKVSLALRRAREAVLVKIFAHLCTKSKEHNEFVLWYRGLGGYVLSMPIGGGMNWPGLGSSYYLRDILKCFLADKIIMKVNQNTSLDEFYLKHIVNSKNKEEISMNNISIFRGYNVKLMVETIKEKFNPTNRPEDDQSDSIFMDEVVDALKGMSKYSRYTNQRIYQECFVWTGGTCTGIQDEAVQDLLFHYEYVKEVEN